jgi:phosphoribosyl-ATP pyrophosphohydrolase/phosphoribosyl-AMP cyclohydrolase
MTDVPVKFDENGLIPVVIQDDTSGEVLMLAFMNREALDQTRATGKTHFWSRSRQSLWRKGETSGHEQTVKSIHVNCYENSLLIRVDQIGACCHTGFPTCYYRELTAENELVATESRQFDPDLVYGSESLPDLTLWIGAYRWLADHDLVSVSGTSRLLRESNVPVLSARVADELREMAGVVTGDHVHENRSQDALLEGSQILYWLVLTSLRFGLSDSDVAEAIKAGLDADLESTGELPPRLRALADEWQRAFFRALAGQIIKTVAMLAEAAEATGARIGAMIDRDLAELRARPYLAEYFARAGA